jgi:GDP-L-fucose synthase
MPCNLYGPNDNYNFKTSHFFPALIKKAHDAIKKKKPAIILWGSGKARRELIYSDDVAEACIFFLNKKTKEVLINVGSGKELSIIDYAKFVIKKLNANCAIKFDRSKPDGTTRKLIDSSIAYNYGWKPRVILNDGFELTYADFLKKHLN